jgi:MYXO-CTERM domain-containing protein
MMSAPSSLPPLARLAFRPKLRAARDLALGALFIVAMGACGSTGGCSCASVQPLPAGGLPAAQTIEGGAQIRVTPHGFQTLTSVLPGLINEQLSAGFCLPGDSVLLGAFSYCESNSGGCTNGCRVIPTLNNVTVTPTGTSNLDVKINAKVHLAMPVSIIGIGCTLTVDVASAQGDVNVGLGTNPTTGELTLSPGAVQNFTFANPSISGCSIGSDIVSFVIDLFKGTVASAISGELSPAIQNLLPSFLPNPLGLVGTLDLGALLSGLIPGAQANLETRLVPGGYATTSANGLNLGVITGLNADSDPSTRQPGQDSQPAACVPPLAAPDLTTLSLTRTSRSTFTLPPATAFTGGADPANSDLALGISQATLDLLGHHIVTSGALCLGVGTSFVSELNLSTISLLVPSLGELASGTGNDPLLLVTRPQRALTFTIGDNTATSPALSIGIDHLEVDFYAFLFERYTRVFTLDLSLNAGINLDFEVVGGQTMIKPTLLGLSSQNVQITVLNADFVRESPAALEAILPTVFDLVTPLLGNLPDIAVPAFAGFELDNLAVQHVTSNGQNFLAVDGSLGSSANLRSAATRNPLLSSAVTAMDARRPAAQAPSTGRARLVSVTTPAPEAVRNALTGAPGGARPTVTFDVDQIDDSGRELEWSYQLNGGLWRGWRSGPLVLTDDAFAWQGKYTIGVKSRVKGDYHTVSAVQQFPVIIDSVAPQIAADKAAWNGDVFEVSAFDSVSGSALAYAFGRPGAGHPESPWVAGETGQLGRDAAEAYAVGGKVDVYVKDEAGNTASATVQPLDASAPSGGCSTGGSPGAGGLLLVLAVGGFVLVRRRRFAATSGALALVGVLTLQPACGGKDKAGPSAPDAGGGSGAVCTADSDCTGCPPGQLGFCVDGTCACSSDIPAGRIGQYSDVAVGPDGTTWVSAYAETHGDLVVAQVTSGKIADATWEWVDGVPAGPVVVAGSTIRGGIADPGPNTGMYTSIAVAADGVPMVSYFDVATASLKLAQKINGAWQIHVVDAGAPDAAGNLTANGSLVGMYTSISLRADDGRPGIAYLAHVKDGTGTRAEVRYASAQVAHPSSSGDWQKWTVDTGAIPAANPAAPDVYPLPAGLGLFVDSARMPDNSPIVTYYDRSKGELKLAQFNVAAGQFGAARVLDGSNGVDAGWTPSIAVDNKGVANIAYVSATTADELRFTTSAAGAVPSVIDNGFRTDGTTVDGLPKPVQHFVGANAKLLLPADGSAPYVVYQDATSQELLLGHRNADGTWAHLSVAGATQPYPGGYGFYAAGALGNNEVVMSSWVVDLPGGAGVNWVEVFDHPTM